MNLDSAAELASIFTALIAGLAYGRYRLSQYMLRRRLESILAAHPRKYMDELIRDLWMSENEIFEAARGSKVIESGIDPGAAPVAARLWMRHTGNLS